MGKYCVYWVHSTKDTKPESDGYVGVSSVIKLRSAAHRLRFGAIEVSIIYRGSEAECLARELELRPEPDIGWNTRRGGGQAPEQMRLNALAAGRGEAHWRYGTHLTDETKAKVAAAKLGTKQSDETRQKRAASMALRKQDPAYQEKMRQQGLKRLGHKNPDQAQRMRQRWEDQTYAQEMNALNIGRQHSEESKQKRSDTLRRRYEDPTFLEMMRASWRSAGRPSRPPGSSEI